MVIPDIFVVGGGPAGLAAAIAARRRGFSVTVADGVVPPADKACGEGLMPDSLAALEELGVYIPAGESFPFRGIRFVDGRATVTADFPTKAGQGVRRTNLHRIMVERAESVGVRLQWGTHVDLASLKSPWVIGADGGNSLVRRWAGLDARSPARLRFGFRRHYKVAPWSEHVEIYWADRCQIYVTPVGPECVGVAAITDYAHVRLDHVLAMLPALAARLRGAVVVTTDRGAISASRRLNAVCCDRIALIGDSSGSVDAITGEGLSLAFRQAPALVAAIEADDLAAYQRRHREIALRPEWMARLLLALGDHAGFRFAAIRGMAAMPWIFTKMLALHVGAPLTSYENDNPDFSGFSRDIAGAGHRPHVRSRADPGAVHAK